MAELAAYDSDPTLYLFTSLTAGSSHIITATSRIETILKANKVAFKGVDTATDELAKKLYQRRARGKKLPLLVREGYVIADLDQVEEWNEYDELKEALGAPSAPAPAVAVPLAASKTPVSSSTTAAAAKPLTAAKENEPTPTQTPEQNLAIRQLGAQAASLAASKKSIPARISTTNPLLASKVNSASSSPAPDLLKESVLSPRSIPLPKTPADMDARVNSPGVVSPGVVSPGVASPPTEFHGRKVESPGREEIKMVEKQTAIEEEEESEEEDEDDEDDEDDDDEEESDEEESDEEEEDKKTPANTSTSTKPTPSTTTAKKEDKKEDKKEEKTQDQPAKAAEKAGDYYFDFDWGQLFWSCAGARKKV